MADSNAERQRRWRQHKSGNHELCRPAACDFTGMKTAPLRRATLPPAPSLPPPAALAPSPDEPDWGPGGAQLWRELEAVTPPAHLPLLREACRIVDRLDRMDLILARKSDWLRVNTMDFGEAVKVKITMDGVLAEARQQAIVAHALIKDLAQFATQQPKAPKTGGLGDLSARIAARRGQAVG